jgi:phage recombination protein Bet
MSTALATLTSKLASRLEMGDGSGLIETLKATAFKGQVSDAQMTALMVVANQYGLNPWTREIYAFPDKNNGIVPVVGVDGWARIINDHPQFDGVEFVQDDESCTCIIFRKDRSHPIKVTEWKSECFRSGFGPWQSHPKRMLRHKALIQCARLAFGYGGIYDQDEAERIIEIDGTTGETVNRRATPEDKQNVVVDIKPTLPVYSENDFEKNKEAWRNAVEAGKKTPDQIIVFLKQKATLTSEQEAEINSWA